ncbi:MAG TPA: sensor histidine kinase [Puia sp.]|nr:sensor histidine kinase [Puia sp.]
MIRRIGIQFILLMGIGCFAIAQPTKVDSLLRELGSAKEGPAKVKLYYRIANQYYKDDLKEAREYCALGLALSRKINYKEGVLDYYTYYSNILNVSGDFDSLLVMNREAVEYAKKYSDSANIGRTMMNVGIAYRQLDDYENAVSIIETAKGIFIRNGVHQYEAEVFDLLQVLYKSMHQYRKAADNGVKAIPFVERSGNEDLMQQVYSNLGLNYVHLHIYDSAMFYLRKAGTLAEEKGDRIVQIATTLNYALISLQTGQYDSIKQYVDKALHYSRIYNAHQYEGQAQYGEAYYYLLKRQYVRSKLYADSAMALANHYNMRFLRQKLYALLSSLNYAMQDSRRGHFYFDEYELLSDSVLNESIEKNAIYIEKKLETERKEAQIQLQQTQLRQKSILNYFLMVGGAALLVISLLTYRSYRSRQKLQQIRIDELEKEKQLTATEAVLKGEEQERTRLAKDLHDGLGGMLSGIKHSLSNVKGNLIMTPDDAQTFERSIDMLDSSIKEMRRVAHNMMPEILVRYGLNMALKEFCNELNRSGVIYADYQSMGMDKATIDQTAAVTIYRIVQELANNAIKHAAASTVLIQVHLLAQERSMAITVEDNGKGFDTALLKQSSGMGWNNIQKRVDFLKGRLDLNSAPGKGTSVLIEINI